MSVLTYDRENFSFKFIANHLSILPSASLLANNEIFIGRQLSDAVRMIFRLA
ncbi:hypothetical protein DJ66_0713 [Candidatus Liberibacter solanacearum]|uniref:Uncharacterized protein n=1 Tax=Candidatus Liberibacter solanacearum TaxID=556287 RepID=A0A0F4VKH2_9HYPH|nr:hypothetical protein DJ66_0713 [Candidatus Liberibacter solanacearum]